MQITAVVTGKDTLNTFDVTSKLHTMYLLQQEFNFEAIKDKENNILK